MKIVYIYLALLLTFLTGLPLTAQQTPTLVREYLFNDNLNENIKNKNAIAKSTIAFVEDRFGNPTGALSFTGNDKKYVETPKFIDHDIKNGYAITFWVYIDKPISPCNLNTPEPSCIQEMFFAKQSVSQSHEIRHLGMRRNGDRLSVFRKPKSNTLTSFELWFWDPVKFTSKGWYFVALSYEKNAMEVSIGSPEGKLSSRRNYFAPNEVPESAIWGIGAISGNTVDRIDDFKVYSGPLSIEDVQKNHENEQGFSTRKNYVIKALHSGKVLTVDGFGINPIVQKSYNEALIDNQFWSLIEDKPTSANNNTFYLQSLPGFYLSKLGTGTETTTANPNERRLFKIVSDRKNNKQYYIIKDVKTSLVLTVDKNSTNDGAKITLEEYKDTDNQRFTFEERIKIAPEIPVFTDGNYYFGVYNKFHTGITITSSDLKTNNNPNFIDPKEKNQWNLKYTGNGNYRISINGQYLTATNPSNPDFPFGEIKLNNNPVNAEWKLKYGSSTKNIGLTNSYYLYNTTTGYMIGAGSGLSSLQMKTPKSDSSQIEANTSFYFLPVENINTAPSDPDAIHRGVYIKSFSSNTENKRMVVSKNRMNASYEKIDVTDNRSKWLLNRELKNNGVYEYTIAGMGYLNSQFFLSHKKNDISSTGFKTQKTFYTIIKIGTLINPQNEKVDTYLIRDNATNQFLSLPLKDNNIKFTPNNDLKSYEHGFYFEEVQESLQYCRTVTITEFSPGSCMYNAETHMDPTLIINAPSNESHFLYNGEWDNYTTSDPKSWALLEASVNCDLSNSFTIKTNDFLDSTVLGVQTFEKNSNGCKRAVKDVDHCNVHIPRFDFNLKMGSVNILELGETRYRYQVTNCSETIPPAQSITKKAVEEPKNIAVIDTEKVILSPNPTDNIVNISWGGFNGFHSVYISSLQGKVMKKIKLSIKNQEGIQVDVQDIPKGMYLVKIYGSAKTVTKKLIIK